jgi:hypothetical protein
VVSVYSEQLDQIHSLIRLDLDEIEHLATQDGATQMRSE